MFAQPLCAGKPDLSNAVKVRRSPPPPPPKHKPRIVRKSPPPPSPPSPPPPSPPPGTHAMHGLAMAPLHTLGQVNRSARMHPTMTAAHNHRIACE